MNVKMTVKGMGTIRRGLKAHRETIVAARQTEARLENGELVPLDDSKRPARGLSIDKALETWSEPADYAAMKEYEDAERNISGIPAYEARHREYVKRREKVERALQDKLLEGTLVASGITPYASGRRTIDPSLWDTLEIDYEWETIEDEDRTYKNPEIFEAGAIPRNIRSIPEWLYDLYRTANGGVRARETSFAHDPAYTHVALADREFVLGPLQANVVRLLHDAHEGGSSWVHGKVLLEQAGSSSSNLGTLFKSQRAWKELIESDGRGNYRLRLRQ
jgi:hypothetical protein